MYSWLIRKIADYRILHYIENEIRPFHDEFVNFLLIEHEDRGKFQAQILQDMISQIIKTDRPLLYDRASKHLRQEFDRLLHNIKFFLYATKEDNHNKSKSLVDLANDEFF